MLDIDTAIGDGGQLGHASSLQSGQRVPAGKRYHGSPGQETEADYRFAEGRSCTRLRRALYQAFTFSLAFLVVTPVSVLLGYDGLAWLLGYAGPSPLDAAAPANAWLVLAGRMALVAFVLTVGFTFGGLLVVLVVPRLLRGFIQKNKTYVLYGFHYYVWKTISALSNSTFHNLLFGDSSFIVYYLRAIGYRLNRIVQTGSNFGVSHKHDDPFLCEIGSGTMVADGLVMINAAMSNSSFQLREVRIGDNNYLGNSVVFPANARTGANCLLATKVLVPIDGPVRENVGLLGSPSFEIPRVVARDQRFEVKDEQVRRDLLRKKNRQNLVTMALWLLSGWFYVACVLLGLTLASLHPLTDGIVAHSRSSCVLPASRSCTLPCWSEPVWVLAACDRAWYPCTTTISCSMNGTGSSAAICCPCCSRARRSRTSFRGCWG